jgi:hypothetical protein
VVPVGLLGLAACGDAGPADAVRRTIGPQGGLISSHDQVLTIVLQPGALAREVEIEVFPSDEPPLIFGPAYRVRPQVELMVDAEITYRRVLPSNPNAATVGAIRLDDYTAEMGHWRPLPRISLSAEQQSVIAIDDELSLYYGLLEDADAPPPPSDDGDDDPPPTDDGPTTSGPTSGTADDGETTVGVDPTTTTGASDGPGITSTDGDGPGSSSSGGGSSSGGDERGMDDGMVVPVCGDGMPQAGELCLALVGDTPAGLGPTDVGMGDLDGDGALDVLTLDAGALEVGVLLGNGDGTLGAPGAGTAVNGEPVALELGDFTGDGELDVAVLDAATDAVLLLAGDGVGGLASPMATAAGAGVAGLAGANFDADAARDLSVLNAAANTVQILLGGPGGLVAGPATPVGAAIDAAIANGSLNPNGDAFADIMAVGAAGFDAWATDGMGTGYVGEITGAFGAGGTFGALAIGDIDEDGDDDVVGVDTAGDALVLGLSTGGAANFVFAGPLAVGAGPSDVALADLDGDGDLDAVVCNATSGDVMIFAWNAGGYALAFTFGTGLMPSSVAVGQLDGDGVPDVVVANAGSDTLTVVLSDP